MKKLVILTGVLAVLCALLVPVQAFAAKCACQALCCPTRATCETECCTLQGWMTCGNYGMPGCEGQQITEPHRGNRADVGLFEANQTPAFQPPQEQPALQLEAANAEPAEE